MYLFKKHLSILLISLFCFILVSCRHAAEEADNPAYHNPLVQPLTEALERNPNHADILYQRGKALIQVDAPALAAKDLEKALSLDTANLKYRYALGQVYLLLNKYPMAVHHLERLLKQAPDADAARLLLADAYRSDGQLNKALQEINTLLRSDASFPGALYALARIELAQKDTAAAVKTLRTAVQRRDGNKAAALLLAECLSAQGYREAVQHYREAFLMDTTDVMPLVYLGAFYEQEEELEQAKRTYYECLLRDPDCTPALMKMGLILKEQDSVPKALRQFQMAIRTQPNSAEAYYQEGRCWELLNRKDSAQAAFKQALIFAPGDEEIKQAWRQYAGGNER